MAVGHLAEPMKPSDIPAIAAEIESYRPDGLLVEMNTDGKPLSRSSLRALSSDCLTDGKFRCGESVFAATVGGRYKARVLGGEPALPTFEAGLSAILTSEERLVLASVKALLMLKRKGIPEEQWASDFMPELNQALPKGDTAAWSFSKFEDWLKKYLKVSPAQVDSRWIEPRSDAGASATQRIAAKAERVREPMILNAAESLIRRSQRTLIVYGSSHFFKLGAAFEAAFGAVKIDCLAGKKESVSPVVPKDGTESAQ